MVLAWRLPKDSLLLLRSGATGYFTWLYSQGGTGTFWVTPRKVKYSDLHWFQKKLQIMKLPFDYGIKQWMLFGNGSTNRVTRFSFSVGV